jgi:hypothetical protein
MLNMKFRKLFTAVLLTVLFTGCGADASKDESQEEISSSIRPDSSTSSLSKDESQEEISYTPIVCRYTVTPTCWTAFDCISLNIEVRDNNTVEVYCSNFSYTIDPETTVTLDYIYGETFDITEAQKQNIISVIEKNRINKIKNCGDDDSCDGSYQYISLCDSDGKTVHNCGGLNPYNQEFENTVDEIMKVLPEDTTTDIRSKSEDVLKEYLTENYPDQ